MDCQYTCPIFIKIRLDIENGILDSSEAYKPDLKR